MTFNERIAAALLGKKPVGFQNLSFTSAAAVALTVPVPTAPSDRPYSAILSLEVDLPADLTDSAKAARFREDGTDPTTIIGMLLAHGGVYEIQGYDQLANFRIIATQAGITATINVTYYKLGDQ